MTTTHEHATRAERIGLTDLERAEKRRRIAEIAWEVAQARDKVPHIEAALAQPNITRRHAADKTLEIAEISFEIAKLRHESALLKDDLKTDKEHFPR